MFKVDGPYATAGKEFKPIDPITGEPATRIQHDWLNTIQREIVAVIEAAGAALNKQNDHQLKDAILSLIEANAGSGGGGGGGGTATVNGMSPVIPVAGNVFALNHKIYLIDNTSGPRDLYLPGGDEEKVIAILDAGPSFTANSLFCYPGTGQSVDTGVELEGLEIDVDRACIFFYQAALSPKWEISSNMISFKSGVGGGGGSVEVTPATNAAPGTISREYNTVQARQIMNATTTPTVYVKQSKVGKMVNITVSQLASVIKDGSAGPIKFPVDTTYLPEDIVRFSAPGRSGGVEQTRRFQITPGGFMEMFKDDLGANFEPGDTGIGWTGNLTFTYSIY